MKTSNKIITAILVLILLIIAYFAYYILYKNHPWEETYTASPEEIDKLFGKSNYCEYDAINDTCLPADSCEFQNDTDGTRICLGKWK